MNRPATIPSSAAPPRGRLPVLLGFIVLAGGFLGLGLKVSRFVELRRENSALRSATANLDQLRQDNTELLRLRDAARQAERAQKEQLELAKLRSEVATLRATAEELPALRAESQRLSTERAAAAAKAGVAAEEDPFAQAKGRAERIACISNIKQICLAARIWESSGNGSLPPDFITMRNELNTPKILICPGDTTRSKAANWTEFDPVQVSYQMLSPGAADTEPQVVFVHCPIHNNAGLVDGSAQQLDGKSHRIEKVDGKFKIVRVLQSAQP